jgi:hypothetical protein
MRDMRLARGGRQERRERMVVDEARDGDAIRGVEMAWNIKAHGVSGGAQCRIGPCRAGRALDAAPFGAAKRARASSATNV